MACCTGRSEKLKSTQSPLGACSRERRPRGHDEGVARPELEALARDLGAAMAFDHAVDRAVGRAVRLAREALGQQLQVGGDGRHRRAAGQRVDVAQLVAQPGIGRFLLLQLGQRLAAACIGVVEDRRGLRRMVVPHRHHVVAEAREAVALGPRHVLHLGVVVLGEAGVEEAQHRDVEAVEPDHRLHHALDALVAMVVPGPRGRDDEVARVHGGALAAHGGVGPLAVDDEAQRRLHVAVRGRHLARHDQLQPGIDRLRDRGVAGQRRVLEHQHAAHGLLGGDQVGRLHQQRADLVVAPQRGHAGRLRLARHQRMQRFPQRREVQRADAVVVVAALIRIGGRGAGGGGVHGVSLAVHGAAATSGAGLLVRTSESTGSSARTTIGAMGDRR